MIKQFNNYVRSYRQNDNEKKLQNKNFSCRELTVENLFWVFFEFNFTVWATKHCISSCRRYAFQTNLPDWYTKSKKWGELIIKYSTMLNVLRSGHITVYDTTNSFHYFLHSFSSLCDHFYKNSAWSDLKR